MTQYKIASMADRPRGSRALVPVIQHSAAAERAMLRELRRFLKRAADGFREILLPAYRRRLSVLTTDVDEAEFEEFRQFVRALVGSIATNFEEIARLDAARHTDAWVRSAKSAFGVDLAGVVTEGDLADYLDASALRSAGLIRGLGDDVVRRVQNTTTTALIEGTSVAELQQKVRHELGVSDARARLIAADQAGKLNSDMNKFRQEEAGVDEYIWRTAKDERVRSRHQALEGRRYRRGEPTGAEDGLEPGQPVRCRCVAQGVVTF